MEWINHVQRDLGEPVIGFVSQNFLFVLFFGFVAVVWLFRSSGGGASIGITIGGDGDGDSGGDSGGGDGGGGGD
jgi:hypothetical protein